MTYDNTNQGAIWPNKKADKPTSPKWTGKLDVEGVIYWISAWAGDKEKPGSPSLKFAIQRAEPKQEVKQEAISDDDIPF